VGVPFLAALAYAAPELSSFTVLTASGQASAHIGEPVYVVARLLTAQRRQVYVTTNVLFTMTGAEAGPGHSTGGSDQNGMPLPCLEQACVSSRCL
jgi:hypothetical protein